MLSTRGAVLGAGAVATAVAGFAYGVEEFVLVSVSVGVLLATGAVVVRYRQWAGRRSLHLVVRVPVTEVTAGQPALVELRVRNTGRHRLAPVLVAEPRRHWSISHPGMGDQRTVASSKTRRSRHHHGRGRAGSVAAASRTRGSGPGARAPGGGGPGRGPGIDTGRRRTFRQRGRDRALVTRSFRLPELAPGADAALWIPVPTSRRGLLTLSDVGVWCEDPFRLLVRRVAWAPPAHVVVYPSPSAEGLPLPRAARRPLAHHEQRRALVSHTVAGDDLGGLRPYAPGDRLTRLHWPALARSGELVVREFVSAQAGSLTLLVDVRPSVHDPDSFEHTISRAAGMGLTALDRGVTVELCTSAGDRAVVEPNAVGRQTLLRALALLGPATPPPAVIRRWGGRPTDGAVWATTGHWDAEVVLVTSSSGATREALPETLRQQADTVVAT